MKTRSDSELSKKNGGIIRPKGFFFFETFWANSSGGLEGPETFVGKNLLFHLFSSSSLFIFSFIFPLISCILFHLVSSFLFHLLSLLHLVSYLSLLLLSSCLLTSLLSIFSSLVFNLLSSLLFSSLVSPLSSSLAFLSCLVFSCLSFSVSLSLSVSLCLCLHVMLCVVLCGVCRYGRGVVGGRGVCVRLCVCFGTLKKNGSVCTGTTRTPLPSLLLSSLYHHHNHNHEHHNNTHIDRQRDRERERQRDSERRQNPSLRMICTSDTFHDVRFRKRVFDLPQWFHVFFFLQTFSYKFSYIYIYIYNNMYTCHQESSRTPQHSNWNCVGANRHQHMHMDSHMVCVIEF